jgi:glycine cleavage system aminomethyltransferase T
MRAGSSRYSLWGLIRHALPPYRPWPPAWRAAEPRARYDAVIIGGGGHGLAAAYYLARHVGLALVTEGRRRIGQVMFVDAPTVGRTVRVTLTEPIFYDPSGEKMRA